MAIRVRNVEGTLIALCAAETDPLPDDLYLDDAVHYALAAKFAKDWRGERINWVYEDHDNLARTQVRAAREDC